MRHLVAVAGSNIPPICRYKNEGCYLGNIHVLRKHKGEGEGVSQMLTFAYGGGGGKGSYLRNHNLEKNAE